jgi:hypothetical protein
MRARRAKWAIQLPRPDLQKYLRTGTDLVVGAFEITANRLACAAEMTREERLYNLFHSQIVGGDPGASVATGGGADPDPCASLATRDGSPVHKHLSGSQMHCQEGGRFERRPARLERHFSPRVDQGWDGPR